MSGERADNNIYFRVSTDNKINFQRAAARDGMNLSQWLIQLAQDRIQEQSEGNGALYDND